MAKLGEGTFGIVYNVHEDETDYALKRNLSEIESSFIGAIRELNLLYLLRNHPHIVQLEKVVFGQLDKSPLIGDDRSTQRDDEVHFIFPKAEYDLHEFIYKKKINYPAMKKIMVEILLGLEYMHRHKMIHRDIKPGNVLIFNVAKLCDFGLSKPYTYQGDQTPGVVTVCYRAPEIVLSSPYDYKADIWSTGCLFYEMVAKMSFVPDSIETDKALLKWLLQYLPPLTPLEFKTWVTNNKNKAFVIANPKNKGKSWEQQLKLSIKNAKKFPGLKEFTDLLSHMMAFHPSKRYDIYQCLSHPFFNDYDKQAMTIAGYIKIDKMVVPDCQERKWMSNTVTALFNKRAHLEWYNTRCLFQAIDLFHRYLVAAQPGLNQFHTNLYFMACIYISIKYFSSIHYPIPFKNIVGPDLATPECLQLVENFEGGLIKNCLQYDIYHETVYEAADYFNDLLTELDISNLLILFTGNSHIHDCYPKDVYEYYRNSDKTFDSLLTYN